MLTVALITRGTPEANHAKFAELGSVPVLLQQDQEVATEYKATGTPGAVLLGSDGTIQSEVAFGAEAIRELVAHATGRRTEARAVVRAGAAQRIGASNGATLPTLKMGDAAPSVRLPDLTGNTVDLADFRGRSILLLFWNPHCGYCKKMLDDLKAWEAQRSQEMPQLIVVSNGSTEENATQGFRSPVLVDTGLTARAYGAGGTPSAILIDSEGRIASKTAAGAQAIFALIAPQSASSPLLSQVGLPS
jgi:peroxiredoxin